MFPWRLMFPFIVCCDCFLFIWDYWVWSSTGFPGTHVAQGALTSWPSCLPLPCFKITHVLWRLPHNRLRSLLPNLRVIGVLNFNNIFSLLHKELNVLAFCCSNALTFPNQIHLLLFRLIAESGVLSWLGVQILYSWPEWTRNFPFRYNPCLAPILPWTHEFYSFSVSWTSLCKTKMFYSLTFLSAHP